jgi:hypothetical protein
VGEAALRPLHEGDHLVDEGVAEGGHALQGGPEGESGAEQQPVGLLQGADLGRLDPGSAKTHHVQPTGPRRVPVRDDEGQAVLDGLGLAPEHGEAPHAAVLVNAGVAPEKGALGDLDVAGERNVVGHDDAIADAVVVGHVGVRHQEAVRTDDGRDPGRGGAVDRDALADTVPVADHETAFGPGEREVLRLAPEDRSFVHEILDAEGGEPLDRRVGPDLTPITDPGPILHDGARADRDVRPELGAGIDDRLGVHGHERCILPRVAPP